MIQTYKIRSIFLFLFFCICYFVVLANLIYLQVIQYKFFTQLGQKQYNVVITTFPNRGAIIDRSGKSFLAINKDSLAAFILPHQLEMKPQLQKFLAKHFPQALERLKTHPDAQFLYVQRKLTQSQIDLITNSGITDIQFLNEPSRFYPLASATPLIGLTNIDNKGISGLELQFDSYLAGTPSMVALEKDARSGQFYFKKEMRQQGLEGNNLILTIDNDLQFLAYEALQETLQKFNAKEGGVVIMDPQTGEILALVNAPSFDPENFNEQDIQNCKNTIITQTYELGSVFKICTALAALEEQVVMRDELIDCKNCKTTFIDGRKINTVKEHGIIPFEQVIAQSNNIGIAQVAKRLDHKLYDHYCRLGFGKKTGICFPGEAKGFINPPSKWSKQSIISLSYGYEITATLLQLARAFSIIANGGFWIEPHITFDIAKKQPSPKLYNDQALNTIKDILEKTTLEGTAHKAKIHGYRIMCKTGTANLLENGQYNPDKNIFTCAGILEKNDYQKVIVTFIKEVAAKDQYASTVAAPLFEQIAQKLLIKDQII